MEKIKPLKNKFDNILVINTHKSTFFFEIQDIIAIKADGAYTLIKTINKTVRSSKSIGVILKNLNHNFDELFFRVERSLAINILHITEIIKQEDKSMSEVILSDGTAIEMPRRISHRILEKFES